MSTQQSPVADWMARIVCMRVYTGISETMDDSFVYIPPYQQTTPECPRANRVLYYEDKKSTHVETALVVAQLTPDEWALVGDLSVTNVRLRGPDGDNEGVAAMLHEPCVLRADCPAMPVLFRTLR
jgi:hypothetical protein